MSTLRRIDHAAPWVIGAIVALPVLLVRFPPMNDLPIHEAVVGVLRHYGDPKYFPPGLYELNLGHPNQAFYLVAWLASLVVSVPMACKIAAAIAIAGVPIGAGVLAHHLHRSPWTALLVAPLALGWLFFWGVVANILGLALLLALLPTLDRACERPSARGAIASVAALVALYFAHEAMLLVACAAVGFFALLHPIRPRETSLRLAPLAPLLALAIAQLFWQSPYRTANNMAVPLVLRSVGHKLVNLPGVIAYEPEVRAALSACALAPMLWLLRARFRHRAPVAEMGLRARAHRYRFEALAAILFGAYLALPLTLNGATLIYQRFLAPAYALAAILVAPRADRFTISIAQRFAIVASPIASLFAILPPCLECHRIYQDYESLLARVEYGASVMNVEMDPFIPHDPVRTPFMQGHAVALRGGRSPWDITESPISPAVVAIDHRWSESTNRLEFDSTAIVPEHDLRLYRYVFVHATSLQTQLQAGSVIRDYATLVDVRGEWALYRSRLAPVPLMAPEPPLDPAAPTFAQRLAGRRD